MLRGAEREGKKENIFESIEKDVRKMFLLLWNGEVSGD